MGKLKLIRTVTTKECPWLERDYIEGDVVHKYNAYTYGCISSDGVACSKIEGKTPFFELPMNSVNPNKI